MSNEGYHLVTPLEQLFYCTVRIETIDTEGRRFFGTAFRFDFSQLLGPTARPQGIPVLVTNRHVLQDAEETIFHFNEQADDGRGFKPRSHFPVRIRGRSEFIFHPNANVDLCLIPMARIFVWMLASGYPIPFILHLAPESLVMDFTVLRPIEEVVMVAYPNALWDELNNLPIVRKGSTATLPTVNFQGWEEFLIDAACWWGSSGSPVFSLPPVSPDGSCMPKLLGVLYGGPTCALDGAVQAANDSTAELTNEAQRILSMVPINIGYVIKARALLDFWPGINEVVQRQIETGNIPTT